MPLPVERLTPDSSTASIQEALSNSIAQCMEEGGREQNQCVAIAFSIARKQTGKHLGSRGRAKISAGLQRGE